MDSGFIARLRRFASNWRPEIRLMPRVDGVEVTVGDLRALLAERDELQARVAELEARNA